MRLAPALLTLTLIAGCGTAAAQGLPRHLAGARPSYCPHRHCHPSPSPTPTTTSPSPTPTVTSPSPSPTSPSPSPTVTSPSPTPTGPACTIPRGGTCGPYPYPGIPMSNGYNTYVMDQQVGPNPATTETLTARDPGNWSVTANDLPAGYTGVQMFDAVQQLTNDWNGTGWGNCGSTCTDTPLSSVPSLTVSYAETSPPGGVWEYAPDVWSDNYTSDVMFWADTSPVRCTGNGLSASDILGQATLSGQQWTAYLYGGAGGEIIFILDGSASTDPVGTGTCARQPSGSIDIKAGFTWLIAHGFVKGPEVISQLNTGWEICSAAGTTFRVTAYTIS